jgi:PAS domain S-box-containing protein
MPPVSPLQKYRARPGLAAVSALVLAAAAALLLVLLPERWERILVAAVTLLAGGALAWPLARRARERERARIEELETAEARHHALLEGLPLVTWLTAPGDRGETLYISPAIAEVTGYSPSEWAEQPDLYLRLLHPDDRDRVVPELERADTGAPVRSLEYRLLARDGRAVWVREDSATVRDSKGEPLYVQTFLRDVGELKRGDDRRELLQSAEREAASESAERRSRLDLLRHVGNQIATGVDLDLALAQVAELIVVDVADWCLIDVADEGSDLRRVAVARGATTSPEGGRVPADEPEAEVRAVLEQGSTSVRPAPDERSNAEAVSLGELEARSVVSVPLGARKQRLGVLTLARTKRGPAYSSEDVALAEDLAARLGLALDRARLYREVEERSDAAWVLEHVADGILLLDRTGVVRLWNPAAEAITFIAAADVVGHTAAEAIPGWKTAVERVPVSASPDPGHDEVLIPVETSRGERWIAISGVRFFGGTVYAFRDLTDARRLEEIKADFIATASHELRTPLAAVYGAAQTLLRHDFALDETGRERFVSLIADESERLGRIVNEILLANQLDAGRLDLESEPFDAGDLVERVVESTRMHAPPSVTLEVEAPESVPQVAADADKVRQVLVNLVENAIKYSPDGGHVEVSIEERDGFLRFHVRDEGLGVAPEDQERIFEKFYRADPQMTRGVGGTGLGLYICRELIDRMGGRIWAEPNGGKGSMFVFELPTAEVMAHGQRRASRLQFGH